LVTLLALVLAFVAQNGPASPPPQKPAELNTLMMESTFKIEGPSTDAPGQTAIGTGFLVGKPMPNNPARSYFVLVTSAHVLADIKGDAATLILRVKTASAPYERATHKVAIRRGSEPLWKQHPTADVAVMYVSLPDTLAVELIAQDFLATDADFEKYEFHAGDEVFTVGYPYGLESTPFGFPVLRSGRIASHPLTPSATLKTFMVDFSVFGGNSGGPIFINQWARQYGASVHLDERVFRILGLVTSEMRILGTGERLNVAEVVHASFIRETIALLPARP
jgi:S1-C subfamily serine protease